MIRVKRPDKPADFRNKCELPGATWLAANPAPTRLKPLWLQFEPALRRAFANRCGWRAHLIEDGTVDHYLSGTHHRNKAYKWTNYRYAASSLNSSKQHLDNLVLDPFEVRDNWFELLLPSMQLRITDRVPANKRTKAEYTLQRLKLDSGIKVRRIRKHYYNAYKAKDISFKYLQKVAPQVAAAVEVYELGKRPLP